MTHVHEPEVFAPRIASWNGQTWDARELVTKAPIYRCRLCREPMYGVPEGHPSLQNAPEPAQGPTGRS